MGDLISEMTGSPNYGKFIGFPIKALGLFGLTVMFLLAATSHDFWLAFLTPRVWKALHMALYVAYGVLVMHVALGAMQEDRRLFIPLLLGGSFALVTALHIAAAWREREATQPHDGWLAVGPPDSIPDKRARIVTAPDGERIAVFRDGDQIGALTNLCAHQNGPLGEGRIIERLRHLPVARLRVPPRGRLRAAALHREARDLPRAAARRHRRGRSACAAAGDDRRANHHRRHGETGAESCYTSRHEHPPPRLGRARACARLEDRRLPADHEALVRAGQCRHRAGGRVRGARHRRPCGGGRVLQGEQGRFRRGRPGGAAGRRHRGRSRSRGLQDLRAREGRRAARRLQGLHQGSVPPVQHPDRRLSSASPPPSPPRLTRASRPRRS